MTWKRDLAPILAFVNAVLCAKPEFQARLEIKERGTNRLALGTHGKTTK